jgi:hypothetical protein
MRVRAGFVTNSSSTSFLIITKKLDEEGFLDLMGVAADSPMAPMFRELVRAILRSSELVDLATVDTLLPPEQWFDDQRLSAAMTDRLRKAAGQGLRAYFGRLSSDEGPVESFFCTDTFEVENEHTYFNCLECVW